MAEVIKKERGLSEVVDRWEQFGLNDNGKLLSVLYGSETYDGPNPVNRELLDSYIYLLQHYGIVPSYYHFHFVPLPSSDYLDEDTEGLVQAGFVDRDLSLNEKARKWAQENLLVVSEEDTITLLKPVAEELNRLTFMDNDELFRQVYASLAR